MDILALDIVRYLSWSMFVLTIVFIVVKHKTLIAQLRESNYKIKLRLAMFFIVSLIVFTPVLSYLVFIKSRPYTPDNIINPIDKACIAVVGRDLHQRWVLDPQSWLLESLYKEEGIIQPIYNPQMDLNVSNRYAHRMRYYQ